MSFCEVPSCETETHANGLCFKHYMRVRRHGSVTGGRNGDGRVIEHHPLQETWRAMLANSKRSRCGHDPRWNDFWTFVADMGERPSERHCLRRKTPKAPYSKNNCEWRRPASDRSQLDDKAEYQRVYRLKRPEVFRDLALRKRFGITLDQYNAMLEAQGGVCAICKKPEVSLDRRSGKPFALAVDHCHAAEKDGAMKIRGLLCTGCNSILGRANDDTALLQAAIAYLVSHAAH